MRPRRTINPKRSIRAKPKSDYDVQKLRALADQASYSGNPEHKRNPGDFGLSPPSMPRQGKTLCDNADIVSRAEALNLLKTGIRKGLVSIQERQGWPQNVWVVTQKGQPLEAMLENAGQGVYHGYPLQDGDPFAEAVLSRWK